MSPHSPDQHLERVHDHVTSTDGWNIGVELVVGPSRSATRGVLAVPGSKHERDAWGPAMTAELLGRGFVVMSCDVRGRGDSRQPQALPSLPPGQLRRVADDVGAAVTRLARHPGISPGAVVLMGEQDTADAVASVAFADHRVGALVLVSPRLTSRTLEAVDPRMPVCVLVSKDDRDHLLPAVELYGRSAHPASRVRVVGEVGTGTTMFAAWQHLHRAEPTLERWLGAWSASVV